MTFNLFRTGITSVQFYQQNYNNTYNLQNWALCLPTTCELEQWGLPRHHFFSELAASAADSN